MDEVLTFLHSILPYLHILALMVVIFKLLLVLQNKGFSLPYFLISFFRIYTARDRYLTKNRKRLSFMRWNNYSNFYIYGWIFLTIILYLIFKNNT